MLSTDVLPGAMERAKGLFFPARRGFWLRFGLVSMFGSRGTSSGNITSFRSDSSAPFDTARVLGFIKTYVVPISIGLGSLFLFGLLWSLIAYTFSFILIDAAVTGNIAVRQGLRRFWRKGLSYFLLNLAITAVNFAVLLLLGMPLILTVIRDFYSLSINSFHIPYLVFFVLFFIVDIIILTLLRFIVFNFVFIDMYANDENNSWRSFLRMRRLILREWREVLVYLVLRIVLTFAVTLITVVIFIIALIPFFIVFFFPLLGLYLLLISSGAASVKVMLVVLIVAVALPALLLLFYITSVLTGPLTGFMALFRYMFVTGLFRRNLWLFSRPVSKNASFARKAKKRRVRA